MAFKALLVAVDGSPSSQLALEQAGDLAAAEQVKSLTLLAVTPPVSAFVAMAGQDPERLQAESRTEADKRLNTAAKSLPDGIEPEVVGLDGDPGRAIIEQAKRGGNDLIVMGSRGHGPIGSLVLGSVSTYVLQHSPVAVLVIHQPLKAEEIGPESKVP
jgi:nucleotide-binding universal stress UspA family protein